MIIEWVGCSGTGKSTLCEGAYNDLLSSGVDVRRPIEIFLGRTVAKAISNERLQNVFLDFLVFPWSIGSAIKHRHFFKYCLKILNRDYSSLWQKLKLLRSILRKTGIHVFLDSCCNDGRPVLVDEGTVHIAHLLFANGNKNCISEKEIVEFCEWVPTPDLIVHIMAPESEVIERAFNRNDKPITDTSPDSIKRFLLLGQEIFKILDDLNPWKTKTITIINLNNPLRNYHDVSLTIANQIKDSFSSL